MVLHRVVVGDSQQRHQHRHRHARRQPVPDQRPEYQDQAEYRQHVDHRPDRPLPGGQVGKLGVGVHGRLQRQPQQEGHGQCGKYRRRDAPAAAKRGLKAAVAPIQPVEQQACHHKEDQVAQEGAACAGVDRRGYVVIIHRHVELRHPEGRPFPADELERPGQGSQRPVVRQSFSQMSNAPLQGAIALEQQKAQRMGRRPGHRSDPVYSRVVHEGQHLQVQHGLEGDPAEKHRHRQARPPLPLRHREQRRAKGAYGNGRNQPGALVDVVGQGEYRPADVQEAQVPEHRAVDRGFRNLAEKQAADQHQWRADLPIGDIISQRTPEGRSRRFIPGLRRMRAFDEVEQRHADQERRAGGQKSPRNRGQPLRRQPGGVAKQDEPQYPKAGQALYGVSKVPSLRQSDKPP